MGRLDGKVALITGASSGIGRASAILFAREGARVVIVARGVEAGEETVRMIEEAGGEAIFVKADVSKTEDVKEMIGTTVGTYGKLDILFNNAAVVTMGIFSTSELAEKDWDKTISINLKGVWLGMKYAIPEMLKQGGGTIINMSSVAGIVMTPDIPVDYAVSKAGVIMLTRTAAIEFAKQNIRVNCICPGHTLTPQNEQWLAGDEEALNQLNRNIPTNRMAMPEEIAQAALFLADDKSSSYITGEALVIDAGYSVVCRG